ncbi:LIM/homeobox protein Lhx2 isoform X3 [Aethina tumida]|uniref:LIM/homeobox protein Lhx2 isoform X3 n=1 Tax=Aethina tumida TaxID=116153 RepID=UPI00096AEE88|nr:LIM/homeobox protein Lhx2 isoform X3 [Aethina tumida]
MGVFEERPSYTPGMHWQQHEQYIGPAYDPSRDLSPNLPSCDSSMGDVDPSISSGSSCSTPSNNNHQSCGSDICRPPPTSSSHLPPHPPQSVTPAELCRPHSSFEHHIPKLEPLQPNSPPTPPSNCTEDGTAICAGCGLRITDRFYLQAVDRRWHATCLQCCQCRNTLDGEITCFSRDGNIYCKKDYYRLFGMKRCGRCQATILSSELVMRARELVFHVHCFSCAVCNSHLTKGDHFGLRDGAVLCRLHFEMPMAEPVPSGMFTPGLHHYPPPFPSPEFHHHASGPPPAADPVGKVPFFNGAPTTPRQKGRPRKRKPKDLEGMTANLDLNSDYLDMTFGRSPGTPGMHGSNQRTKRMRTSFKHHQLRTMKSYFAINHNPDAKDLKQLSQKTGLPKRVLQVWFQNARAKWRRMMLKQEGKSGDKCSGSESMSDMDMYPHGPGSMGSSISMAPHSPFNMHPGSPSSLDCS